MSLSGFLDFHETLFNGGINSTAVAVSAVLFGFAIYYLFGSNQRKSGLTKAIVPEPPTTILSDNQKTTTNKKKTVTTTVCVVGGGTIGSSFAAVYLAQGCEVICIDPKISIEKLQQRIREYWMVLEARDKIKTLPQNQPPLDSLTLYTNLEQALEDNTMTSRSIDFVQECAFEDVDVKQQVLEELDRLVDPNIIIASSTSFIPWNLLVQNCTNKYRILIGHPAIPHTHSFMEIYGCSPEWVNHCKQFYTGVGFDVIVMNKTLPGHVLNSFLRVNLDHACKLIGDGIVSAQDCNTAMRHVGRDIYGRHALVALRTMIGGDRGFEGGTELADRIMRDAVYLILFSGLKKYNTPDFVARPISRSLGRFISTMIPKGPDEWYQACQDYESTITHNGKIPVQTAYFQATSEMYKRVPFEPENDPLGINNNNKSKPE